MMPSEFRHQKISIFADLETLKKEERARRRILRIQQVRQQSKLVASQVIARTRTLKEKEEDFLRQQKEEKLKQWKHQKLSSLRVELDYGLECIGESFKTVDKEIEALKEKQEKKLQSEKLAQERGLIAAKEAQKELEEEQLREERRRRDREELRALENLRAKAIASLPDRSDSGKSSLCKVPTLSLPNSSSSRSTQDKTGHSADSGNKVEVYNYSQPQQQQFSSLPDNVVEKLTPSTCKVTASEQAEEELKAQAEREKERIKKEKLSHWLGTAACARKSLQKEYNALRERLPVLVQQEAVTRIDAPVTLAEIAQVEKEKKSKQPRKPKTKKVTIAEPPVTTMEPHQNGQDTPPQLNFTEFPTTQFTEEEAGALGATASSLQVLLDSLAEESRRRLQEVVDDDDFDFYDEDFDEPPPESPPPTNQVVSSRKVTLDVKTTHQVVVEGTPPSSPSTITSTSEVNVTVTSKSKNKRKKKKSKAQVPPSDTVPDAVDAKEKADTAAKIEGQKSSKKKSKKKSHTLESPKEKQEEEETSSSGQVSGSLETEDSETSAKVVKSVEIDDRGVAYIKKTPVHGTQDASVSESVSGAVKRDLAQGQTSYSEDLQFRYNKQSFVSNSTQYHSPPDNLLGDENIEKYLKSIEKEKSEVEAFLHSKSKQKTTVTADNINLPQYIGKLLTMTRDSVDNLSVSDVTETSSDISGSRKKKKRRSKKKSTESSTSIEMVKSPSTEDSQVTVSLPSPGLAVTHTPDSASGSEAQLSSSTSLDSKLKFSESSSNKESSLSDDSKLKNAAQSTSGVLQSYEELDSTAYLSLQDLSSKVPTKVSYGSTSKSVNIHIDLSKMPSTTQNPDVPARPTENARLSTIIEADSLVAEEEKSFAADSSSSVFDVEAELKKRGLPTLALPMTAQADRLLSPELEKKLQEMNVVPWSSNMMRRMKQAESLSSSSDEVQPRLSDSSCSDRAAQRPLTEPGISHSTPVSMEGGLSSELTSNQTQRFFLQDSVVSPIAPTEEKESRSLSSS